MIVDLIQILKREIDIPETMSMEVSQFEDYPPRLSVYVQQPAPSFTTKIFVKGLDIEFCFNLVALPPVAGMDLTHVKGGGEGVVVPQLARVDK